MINGLNKIVSIKALPAPRKNFPPDQIRVAPCVLPKDYMQHYSEYLQNPTIKNRNKVITANIGLVYNVLRRYRKATQHDYNDFLNEGILGFIRALETVDPSKGSIEGYVWLWIRQSVIRYMKKQIKENGHTLDYKNQSKNRINNTYQEDDNTKLDVLCSVPTTGFADTLKSQFVNHVMQNMASQRKNQQYIVKSYLQDLEISDIAKNKDCSEQAVRKSFDKAIAHLRLTLGNYQ